MRTLCRGMVAAGIAIATWATPSVGEASEVAKPADYPDRPVEVVVRSGAGSGSEAFARAITQHLADELGFTFKYSFMPGADGAISSSYLLDQPADGYTIYIASPTQLISMLRGHVNYTLDDWIWLTKAAHELSAIHVLVDNEQFGTFQDVLDYCKIEDNPQITVAGAGAISFDRVWIELLNQAMGRDCLRFVPFNESAERRASFMGGHTTLLSGELAEMDGQFQAGQTKPILIGSEVRVGGDYAEVETTKDYDIEVFLGRWRGVAVKAGTPQEIVDYLDWAFAESFHSDHYQSYLTEEAGLDASRHLGVADFKDSLGDDMTTMETMLKSLNLL